MQIIILTLLIINYIKFGLLVVISILIWTIVFLLSNFLIGINPYNKEMYIIRIISILVIERGITFLEDILNDDQNYSYNIIFFRKPNLLWLKFGDYQEITNLLSLLNQDKAYIVSFDLILDENGYQLGEPSLILGPPILISKDSNPWLISGYISSKIIKSSNSYDLNDQNEVSILVKYQLIKHYFVT